MSQSPVEKMVSSWQNWRARGNYGTFIFFAMGLYFTTDVGGRQTKCHISGYQKKAILPLLFIQDMSNFIIENGNRKVAEVETCSRKQILAFHGISFHFRAKRHFFPSFLPVTLLPR